MARYRRTSMPVIIVAAGASNRQPAAAPFRMVRAGLIRTAAQRPVNDVFPLAGQFCEASRVVGSVFVALQEWFSPFAPHATTLYEPALATCGTAKSARAR